MDVGLWLLLVLLGLFWMWSLVSPPPPGGCGGVVVAGVSECFSDGGGDCKV